MCGIGLLLSLHGSDVKVVSSWNQQLSETLLSRGPDVPCRQECCIGSDGRLTLHASVLHMRGQVPTPQPTLFDGNCALCWNGECYSYNSSASGLKAMSSERSVVELTATANEVLPIITSDTDLVVNLLQDALYKSQELDVNRHHEIIADVMGNIHGEFAFILFVPQKSNVPPFIYYGRDPLGRRSLLLNRSIDGVILLSSVAINSNFAAGWVEIPPAFVYRMDLQTGSVASEPIPRVINRNISQMTKLLPIQTPPKTTIETDTIHFLKLLDKAVERRVANAPPAHSKTDASLAVLFSGGIDSVVLAALSHRHIPMSQPIDLINVSFFNNNINSVSQSSLPHSPDRLAAILSCREMQARFPERKWRFIAVDIQYKEVLNHENRIRRLICPLESTMDFNIAAAFWFAARGKGRLLGQEEVEGVQRSLNVDNNVNETSSQQPLLRFARQCDDDNQRNEDVSSKRALQCIREGCSRRALPGCIFQSCKFCCGKLQGSISSYLGKSARVCPTHNQRDVMAKCDSKAPTKAKENIANSRLCGNDITSSAKILLSGVGADEQLAGYSRHRTTFQRGGYVALKTELNMELGRLWTRNLGRDDRAISDHGKEARFPFLDEDVVAYLELLPVERRCDMCLSPGAGDKLLLREVARLIGVQECSTLVKRAIQFGSRIAKVSDKARFGSCRRATGIASIPRNR